jgi:hypothetical protein
VPLDARLKYRPGFLSVRMTPPHLSVLPFDLFAHDDPSTRDGVDGETSRGVSPRRVLIKSMMAKKAL